MSYNGTGTFNINTSGQPVVTGTTITSTAFNLLTADLANGLTTAITKDGQTTPTANIPMGGFKVTGLGAGTSATDAAQYGQLQANATTIATVTGTDTLTGSLTPALPAYATGNLFSFVASGTNTGAATINLNSLGAKSITKKGSTALDAGDIVTGQVYLIEYDGTRFQLLNPSNANPSVTSISFGSTGLTPSTATGGVVTVAGTLATTNGGTNLTSFTSGGALYATSTSALTTGTLPIASGGTNSTATPTAGGVGYGTGTAHAFTAVGTANQVLLSNGSSAPTWGQLGNFGSDISYADYSLTTSTNVGSSTIYMQSVSLDGTSELMILQGSASAHAVIWNSSTNTFGTPVLVRTAYFNAVQYIGLAKISSTSVLMCSLPSGSTALETVVLTISGSTITVNTALATTLAATSNLITPNTRLVTVGSSYVLNYLTTSDQLPKFRAITVSGTTPSIGAELAYGGGLAMSHSYAYSSSILLHISSSNTTLYAYPITVSGTTLTGGTQATKTLGINQICTGLLSTGRVAILYLDNFNLGVGALISVTGSTATITASATTLAFSGTYAPQMQVFSNQAFICSGSTTGEQISILTDTAGVPVVGTPVNNAIAGRIVGYLSTGKIFFASNVAGNSQYCQYGISSGAAVLEKTFQSITNTTTVTAQTLNIATYNYPLSGPPQSASNNTASLRTSTGKTCPATSNTQPFATSIDGTNYPKLQQTANPYLTTFNDAISDSVAWGVPTSTGSTATVFAIRKVTLI